MGLRVLGSLIDLDAPVMRLRDKSKVRRVEATEALKSPKHPADVLAKQLYEKESWEPKYLASLALYMSKTLQQNDRMVRKEADAKPPRPQCNFLSGGFTFSGISGIRSATNDHEWVTKYLCSYLSRHISVPFAGVGLALNVDHELHRDLHNQRGCLTLCS